MEEKKELIWECKCADTLTHRIVATKGKNRQVFENEADLIEWEIKLLDEYNNIKICVWEYYDVPPSLTDCIILLSQNIQETLIKFAKYGTEIKDIKEECNILDEDQEIWSQTKQRVRK